MNTLSPGTPLQGGKYRIEEPLAQNDFCITYLATWAEYGLRVCIKEFFMNDFCHRPSNTTVVAHTAAAADGGDWLLDPERARTVQRYQRQFLHEARTIARLDHPSIVRIHDRFEENNTAYYVMEFVEGPSLADIVRQHGKMEEKRAKTYVRQIGEALHYMHEQGVTHLAVRPSHIMVRSRDDVPVLIDFSMARHEAGNEAQQDSADEQWGAGEVSQRRHGSFSPATDVYALAETLEELLTGEIPAMLPDVPSDVMEFLQMSGCAEPPAIEEVDDTYDRTRVLGAEGDGPRIRIHSAADVAAEASRTAAAEAAAKQAAQEAAMEAGRSSGRSGLLLGGKGRSVQQSPVPKTEEELMREKYGEVSQMFVRNMSRGGSGQSTGSAAFGVVLVAVLIVVTILYFLLK